MQLSLHSSLHNRAPRCRLGRSRTPRRRGVAPRAAGEVAAVFAPGVVQTVFSAFNVALLPPWFLMIFAPNTDFTKATIRSGAPMALFAAFYAYLFVAATAQNAAAGSDLLEDVAYLFTEATADPDKMAAMFAKPAYAAQDWAHLCAWDYFVGQWIYLQGLEKNVFTRHSVLITFNTGPFGLLLHWATEAITLRLRGGPDTLQAKIEETRRIAAEQEARLQQAAGQGQKELARSTVEPGAEK